MRMEKLRTHPYMYAIVGAILLVLLGIFVVARSIGVAPQGGGGAWGSGERGFLDPTAKWGGTAHMPQPGIEAATSAAPFYIRLATAPSTPGTQPVSSLDELLALLSAPPGPAAARPDSSGEGGIDPYELIPRGLIAVPEPRDEMNDTQRGLHTYGNAVGALITAYEKKHVGSSAVLAAQATDRSNAGKREAARTIAVDLEKLGRDIAAIQEPASASAIHTRLSAAYEDAGATLELIFDADSDEDFLRAIRTYNSAAEEVIRSSVALVSLFMLHDVAFSSSEAGSIFMFSGN